MSTTIIHKCDKCNKEITKGDQMWQVGVTAQCYPLYGAGNAIDRKDFVTGKVMDVCRPCLESFGVHVRREEPTVTIGTPSLEDLIREIVQQEVGG